MLIGRNLHQKSSEVCIKTRSSPASFSFKGLATKHTTVKCSIAVIINVAPQFLEKQNPEFIYPFFSAGNHFSLFTGQMSFEVFLLVGHLTNWGPFLKVPKLFGRILGDIISFVSSKRRRLESRNLTVILIFHPFAIQEKTSFTE